MTLPVSTTTTTTTTQRGWAGSTTLPQADHVGVKKNSRLSSRLDGGKTSIFCLRAPSQRTGKISPFSKSECRCPRGSHVFCDVQTSPCQYGQVLLLVVLTRFLGPGVMMIREWIFGRSSPTQQCETPRACVLASRATPPARCSPSRAVAQHHREGGVEGFRSSCLVTAGDSVESFGLIEVTESHSRSCMSELVNSSMGVACA